MKYDLKNRLKNIRAILSDTDGVLLRRDEYYFSNIDSGKKHSLHLDDVRMIRQVADSRLNIGLRCEHEIPFCKEKLFSYGISDLFTTSNDVTKAIKYFLANYNLALNEVGYLTASPSRVMHFLPQLMIFVPADASELERKLSVHKIEKGAGEGCLAETINLVLDSHKVQKEKKEKRDLTGYHPFYY